MGNKPPRPKTDHLDDDSGTDGRVPRERFSRKPRWNDGLLDQDNGQSPERDSLDDNPSIPEVQEEIRAACENNDVSLLRALRARGADYSKRLSGRTFPLIEAARSLSTDVVRYLLKDEHVQVHVTNRGGWTALSCALYACESDEQEAVELVKLLLAHGADVASRDPAGFPALLRAAKCGQVELSKIIVKHGADMTACDSEGNSALHLAALSASRYDIDGTANLLNFLIDAGADSHQRNNNRKTALEVITSCNQPDEDTLMAIDPPDFSKCIAALERGRRLIRPVASPGQAAPVREAGEPQPQTHASVTSEQEQELAFQRSALEKRARELGEHTARLAERERQLNDIEQQRRASSVPSSAPVPSAPPPTIPSDAPPPAGEPVAASTLWKIRRDEIVLAERIGEGSAGSVFRATWQGAPVAAKILEYATLNDDDVHRFCDEVHILESIRHPNLLLYMGACRDEHRVLIVTEYLPEGSLFHYLHVRRVRPAQAVQCKMALDVATALAYLHGRQICHRDLKSSNILLTRDGALKIGDFGMAHMSTGTTRSMHTLAGTYNWMAPEIMRDEPYGMAADVFSFAMVLYELIVGCVPFPKYTAMNFVNQVGTKGTRPDVASAGDNILIPLLQRCWDQDPGARPIMRDVLVDTALQPAPEPPPPFVVAGTSGPASLPPNSVAIGRTCAICLVAPRDTVFLPCRHLCACKDCADQLSECPMCRTAVAERMLLYVT